MRIMKRSRCASGRAYVPSISNGFWVATTRNGAGSGCVRPSTVTCPSSIASSSADCVLGEERLISSAMTMLAKIAPCLNSNSRSTGLKTLTPVTSPGSRSGVNWMRRTVASTDAASARASMVLPTPGTSSMSRWPSASRQTSALRTASGFPSITWLIEPRMAAVWAANPSASIATGLRGAFSGMRSLSSGATMRVHRSYAPHALRDHAGLLGLPDTAGRQLAPDPVPRLRGVEQGGGEPGDLQQHETGGPAELVEFALPDALPPPRRESLGVGPATGERCGHRQQTAAGDGTVDERADAVEHGTGAAEDALV